MADHATDGYLSEGTELTSTMRIALLASAALWCQIALAQGGIQSLRLDTLDGLSPNHVAVEPSAFDGRAAVRVTIAPTVKPGEGAIDMPTFALIEGTEDFHDGIIEVSLS